MNDNIWLLWMLAIAIACMPLSILLMQRKSEAVGVDGSSSEVREEASYVTTQDIMLWYIAYAMAQVQMRQYWDKDIDHIV